MKNVTNVALFNGIAGRLFSLLYERFPFYADVDVNLLGIELVDKDDFDGAWNITELAEATVHWLAAAGYIWLKETEELGATYSAVLSPKGFEVLKTTPEVIDTSKTLGQKIVELSKGKLSTALDKTVELAISQGFKLMFSRIGS